MPTQISVERIGRVFGIIMIGMVAVIGSIIVRNVTSALTLMAGREPAIMLDRYAPPPSLLQQSDPEHRAGHTLLITRSDTP